MTDEDMKIYLTRIMTAIHDMDKDVEQTVKSTLDEIYQIGFAEGKETDCD